MTTLIYGLRFSLRPYPLFAWWGQRRFAKVRVGGPLLFTERYRIGCSVCSIGPLTFVWGPRR